MSKRIRIYFTNWVDENNFNAQSLNAREIALRLDPARFESTLLYERTPDPRVMGCENIHLIRIPPRLGTATMLAQAFRKQDIIFRVNLTRFAYLYFHFPKFLRGKTRVVDWLEGYAYRQSLGDELSPTQQQYFHFIQPRIPYHVAITDAVGQAWKQEFGTESLTTIPIGVDTKQFTPPLKRENKTPRVIYVGALLERKGPHFVLMAARCFPHAQFILVGGKRGEYYKRLYKLADKWGLDNVTWLDPMPHTELAQLLQTCDIFLHPSKTEGFPKVVLEAAATGLPALIFDHYRAPAVVDGVTGFQAHEVPEMMARLGWLLEHPVERVEMGLAARAYAETFDWKYIVKKWEQVFLEILARR